MASLSILALQNTAPGTFVVRLCSKPGCFVVSTRVRPPSNYNHLLLDRLDLQGRSLLKWIEAHDPAKYLMHVSKGTAIPKVSRSPCILGRFTKRHFKTCLPCRRGSFKLAS